jgi:DNA-binding NtrC family response regulator
MKAGDTGSHKNILLVDADPQTREARAKVLRSRGATVEAVGTADAARARFRSDVFSLVLLDAGSEIAAAEGLAEELRAAKPRQLIAFLVGRPAYVALTTRPQRVRAKADKNGAAKSEKPRSGARDFGQRVREAEAQAEGAAAPAVGTEDVA